MPATKKLDARFYEITNDLHWRLDDSGGGPPPPRDPDEFDRGGGGSAWPRWATHVIAFLLGALTFGWLVLAPVIIALIVFVSLVALVSMAARRRWH